MKYSFLLLSLVLAGCTRAGTFLANVPSQFDGRPVVTNVSYGPHSLNTLDIYLPAEKHQMKKDAPVLVFFHGGRWQDGNKEIYRFLGSAFSKHGYIVVIPDYRKYPEVKFPVFAQEAADIVRWVYENIDKYNGDPGHIFISGHSSGAHTAAIITADERYLKNKNIIKGFAGLAGPFDFTPEEEDLKDIFGPPENYDQMRVTTFIDGSEPPMLLLYGLEDEVVGLFNLERVQKKIQEQGGDVKVRLYEDLGHAEMIKVITWIYYKNSTVLQDMLEFFESVQPNQQQ